MIKSFLCILLAMALLCLAACSGNAGSQIIVEPTEEGRAVGGMGDVMRTPILDFVVKEVEDHSKYSGQAAFNGEKFVEITIEITITSEEKQVVRDTDFQLQWGVSSFADPLAAWDEKMAPLESTLEAGESVEYHYIYTMSVNITTFSLCYYYDDPQAAVAQIFYVEFSL